VKTIVDTSVWSLAFRRHKATAPEVVALEALLRDDDALLPGVVRQELLSGVRDPERFRLLRDQLRKLPDYALLTEHYEIAAEGFNTCRSNGLQGSNTDFLLCAISQLDRLPIFTTDGDFRHFAKYLPITLYEP
jgi:predicted nucleic acid-binding protein